MWGLSILGLFGKTVPDFIRVPFFLLILLLFLYIYDIIFLYEIK